MKKYILFVFLIVVLISGCTNRVESVTTSTATVAIPTTTATPVLTATSEPTETPRPTVTPWKSAERKPVEGPPLFLMHEEWFTYIPPGEDTDTLKGRGELWNFVSKTIDRPFILLKGCEFFDSRTNKIPYDFEGNCCSVRLEGEKQIQTASESGYYLIIVESYKVDYDAEFNRSVDREDTVYSVIIANIPNPGITGKDIYMLYDEGWGFHRRSFYSDPEYRETILAYTYSITKEQAKELTETFGVPLPTPRED